MSVDPHGEYARRLEDRKTVADVIRRQDGKVGTAGLWSVTLLLVAGVAWLMGWVHLPWPALALLSAAVFWAIHVRYENRLRPLDSAIRFYDRALARVDDRWAGHGREGKEHEDPAHPYATDLDLFGKGSIFELLCTTQTRAGEKTLAGWLLAPAAPGEIRSRQEAVKELRDRLDLREELVLLAGDLEARVKPEELAGWAAAPRVLTEGALRGAAVALAVLNVAALAAGFFTNFIPFACTLFLVMTFARFTRLRVGQVTELAETAERDLDLLARVLARLEREPVSGARLKTLARKVQLLQSVKNELVSALAGLVLWRVHVAFALESWKERHSREIPGWLAAVGEMEALLALAGYAYERPADPFPEIVEGATVYEAEQVGHPLLPAESCVRNDVHLGASPRILIVSGSNMSGKSTLLRTVGANAVLAFAGAPVRAKSLRLSPLSIGATIRVQDSLQAGTSRFYAEISRLRQVMDLGAGPRPLLFLLEEILHGTNSHDRAIGADLVLRGLLEKDSIGLVTTHDLALTVSAGKLDGRAANVHFEDQIENGKLAFDYKLRPGVTTKSNALQLMRSVGLPV